MNYIELSNKSFDLLVDANSTATKRFFSYAKLSLDVLSKPYGTTAPEALIDETLDRMQRLVDLQATYLRETGSHAASVANELTSQADAWKSTAQQAVTTIGEVAASNLEFVKETATKHVDGIAEKVTAKAKASSN